MIDSRRMATIHTTDGKLVFIPDTDPQEIVNELRTATEAFVQFTASDGPVFLNVAQVARVGGP